MQDQPTLYLIPTNIGESDGRNILPLSHLEIVRDLDMFIVENEKTARKFLKLIEIKKPQSELEIHAIDKHARDQNFDEVLEKINKGKNGGLLSEAGVPCVADPGSRIVDRAHEKGIRVVPLVGPSSILLALMASGMNGQQFTFHGYLPIDKSERVKKIRFIEKLPGTQIFIETPYRSDAMLKDLLKNCKENTRFCIAVAVSTAQEKIRTQTVEGWRKNLITIGKQPTVFLIEA